MVPPSSPRTPEQRALKSIAHTLVAHDELMQHMLECGELLPPEQRSVLAHYVRHMMADIMTIQAVLPLPDVPDF